jgi:hypothetical protein
MPNTNEDMRAEDMRTFEDWYKDTCTKRTGGDSLTPYGWAIEAWQAALSLSSKVEPVAMLVESKDDKNSSLMHFSQAFMDMYDETAYDVTLLYEHPPQATKPQSIAAKLQENGFETPPGNEETHYLAQPTIQPHITLEKIEHFINKVWKRTSNTPRQKETVIAELHCWLLAELQGQDKDGGKSQITMERVIEICDTKHDGYEAPRGGWDMNNPLHANYAGYQEACRDICSQIIFENDRAVDAIKRGDRG